MIALPEPPFEELTDETIRERMFAGMDSGLDVAEGSLAYTFLAPVAIELSQIYALLDQALELSFLQTTYGQFLDARAEEHGLTRKAATFATLTLEFSGSMGTTIPAGTLVSTTVGAGSLEQVVTFSSDAEVVIPVAGTEQVLATANEAGVDGNVPIGSVTRILTPVAGLASVTNVTVGEGGTDEETDAELRARLLERLADSLGAGTADDYEQWALEVEGVGFAAAEPLWSGPGTVRVMILDSNGDAASAGLITAVGDYIETLRPIGASVTVATPTLVAVNVATTVTLETGYTLADVTPGVEAAIAAYFATLGPGDDVIRNEVGAAVVTSPGVADWTALTLNGGGTNVAITATQLGDLGTVTVS